MRLIGLAVVLTLSLVLAPLVAAARQPGKVYRVGILTNKASDPAEARQWQALRLGLRERGWIEGENMHPDDRPGPQNARAPHRFHPGGQADRGSMGPRHPLASPALQAVEKAGRTLRVQVQTVGARTAAELEGAFAAMVRARTQAILVLGNPLFLAERQRVAELAIKHRLPTMSNPEDIVEAGGLMSYSPNFDDLYRRGAVYVDKILRGAKPADLPVEQATKFELVINMKRAKALGLTIPQTLLLRADQIIE